jgi:hypothetical protein
VGILGDDAGDNSLQFEFMSWGEKESKNGREKSKNMSEQTNTYPD